MGLYLFMIFGQYLQIADFIRKMGGNRQPNTRKPAWWHVFAILLGILSGFMVNGIIALLYEFGGSASGRPTDSGSVCGGSNPPPQPEGDIVALMFRGLGHCPLRRRHVRIPLGLPKK